MGRTGLWAQLGLAEETTFGTYLAPTRWFEFIQESLKLEIERIESKGLRAGTRVVRSDRWYAGKRSVSGGLELELADKGFGLLWKHALGGVATTQPDSVGNPTVYDHTFTPGTLDGKSLTIQVGRPDLANVVQPFSYLGCQIGKWELAAQVGALAQMKLDLIATDETTAQALATPAYPADVRVMTFVQGTLKLAGSAVDVRAASIEGETPRLGERYALGRATRSEAYEADMRPITGQLDADFSGLTAYNRFAAGAEAALELLFEGRTISGAYKFQTKLTANVRFDGNTPNVGGPDEIRQPLPFKCVDTGSGPGSALTVLYRTTDSTP